MEPPYFKVAFRLYWHGGELQLKVSGLLLEVLLLSVSVIEPSPLCIIVAFLA